MKYLRYFIGGIVILLGILIILINYLDTDFRTDPELLIRRADLGGADVEYIRSDDASYLVSDRASDKPWLIAIHGSPGSADNYVDFFRDTLLRQKFRILAPDRLGLGYMDMGQGETSLAAHAGYIFEILQRESIDSAILVGHSYGCPVAVQLSLDYPERVEMMVLVAAPVDPDLEPARWWRYIIDAPLLRSLCPPALRASNRELLSLKEELAKQVDRADEMTTTAHIIQGQKDNLVPYENAPFYLETFRRASTTLEILPEGDHFILWSEHDRIVDYIMRSSE